MNIYNTLIAIVTFFKRNLISEFFSTTTPKRKTKLVPIYINQKRNIFNQKKF